MRTSKDGTILTTYRLANGEPVWGEYSCVFDLEFFDECWEKTEVIEEVWELRYRQVLVFGEQEDDGKDDE